MTRDEHGAPVRAVEVPTPETFTLDTGITEGQAAAAIAEMLDGEEPAPWEEPDTSADEAEEEIRGEHEGDDDTADDSDDADGEEDAEGGEAQTEATYKVKLADGSEAEVTLAELQSGYVRQSDYTRKTQEVAALRQEVAQKEAAAYEANEALAQRLELVGQFMAQNLTPEQAELLHGEYIAAQQRRAEHQQAERAKLIEEQSALLVDALPEWKDAKVAATEKRALVDYAESLGFTEADLRGATDHRALLLLRKAMLYDRMATSGADAIAKAKKVGKVLQPGYRDTVAPKGGKRRALKEASDRARRTGSVSDAAVAIYHMIDD